MLSPLGNEKCSTLNMSPNAHLPHLPLPPFLESNKKKELLHPRIWTSEDVASPYENHLLKKKPSPLDTLNRNQVGKVQINLPKSNEDCNFESKPLLLSFQEKLQSFETNLTELSNDRQGLVKKLTKEFNSIHLIVNNLKDEFKHPLSFQPSQTTFQIYHNN